MGQSSELTEICVVPDTLVSGLGEVESIGGGLHRFTFYVMDHGRLMVVAKLVAHKEAVPPALRMAARAIGACACEKMKGLAMH